MATDPADHLDEDTGRSGERRLKQQAAVAEAPLPPTPDVIAHRPRIITGAYAIIRAPKPDR